MLVLLRVAGWGALVLLCLFLIALAINARDEPLSTEAQALLQLPTNPFPPERNIYVALAGGDAPPNQSVFATGQAKISRYNEQIDAMLTNPVHSLQDSADPLALKFKGNSDFCVPRERSFWASVRENAPKIRQLVEQNRELYQRYLALQDLPGYFETELPSASVNIFWAPKEVRSLFLAEFALEMQNGNDAQKQAALTSLGQDITLWHRVLAGEGNLISKMLAVAYLQDDYLVLSDVIADPGLSIPSNFDSFLPNTELNDWNVGKVFASEFRLHSFVYRQTEALYASGWQQPDSADSYVLRWINRALLIPIEKQFFKLNATENLDAKLMNELAEFCAIEPATFSAQRARYKKWENESSDFLKLRTIYNPMGKVLVAIGAPAYGNYPLRPYDAAALARLVRLSLEIRLQQVAPSGIPEFMKLHPEWSTHPADGHPFTWEPTTGEIAISPIAKQRPDRRFSVQVWREPPT